VPFTTSRNRQQRWNGSTTGCAQADSSCASTSSTTASIAARWLAQVRGLLEATGSHPRGGRLPADPDAAVERIEWEWEQDHVVDQDLNRSAAIEEPLSRWFPTHARSWHPYLYWDILEVLDVPDPATEKATATLIADWEAALLAAGDLSPVLLRFVGHHHPG
jgi:hypothetical protein